jgi:hypothetical protein
LLAVSLSEVVVAKRRIVVASHPEMRRRSRMWCGDWHRTRQLD